MGPSATALRQWRVPLFRVFAAVSGGGSGMATPGSGVGHDPGVVALEQQCGNLGGFLDDTQLREQPEGVGVGVLDDDLASGDLGDRDARDAHPPP